MNQFTCKEQGTVRLNNGTIEIKNWRFGVVETELRDVPELTPYIMVGAGMYANSVLSVNHDA